MFLGSVAPPSSACISCPVLTSVSAMSCGSRWSRIVWQPWPPSSPNHTSLLWTDALQPSYRWCRPVRITTKTSFTTTWKDIIKTTINSLTKGGKKQWIIYLSHISVKIILSHGLHIKAFHDSVRVRAGEKGAKDWQLCISSCNIQNFELYLSINL